MAYKMLIDGQLVDGNAALDVINPATGNIFATCARADAVQLEQAVAAAKAAFPAWAAHSFEERGACLEKLADALEAEAEEMAKLLTSEQGKPLTQAMNETLGAIAQLRYSAASRVETRTVKENDSVRIIEHRTPLGVVAAITPWNFPLLMMAKKIAPALITGNTVVAKPAPTTPLTSLRLAKMAAAIFPAGVLNMIVDANDLGSALTGHADVRKVSFTGSTGTGRRIMAAGADSLKRITLELGGNDAAILLDDVDVKEVAPRIFNGAMVNAGQICVAIKRVYAPAALYDELCDELGKLANAAVVDDGANQGAQIGPVQNAAQFEKLKGFMQDARDNGTIVAGGEITEGGGYFVHPTIVRDIADTARLVREEQFGPILPIMKYDDIEDAIARANDSEYGLGGSIWTQDIARGVDVAMKIDTGTMWINKNVDIPFDVPFGGSKQSGIGREGGEDGLEAYLQPHIVNVALNPA